MNKIIYARSFGSVMIQIIALWAFDINEFAELFYANLIAICLSFFTTFINVRSDRSISESNRKFTVLLLLSIFTFTSIVWTIVSNAMQIPYIYGVIVIERSIAPVYSIWISREGTNDKLLNIEWVVYALFLLLSIVNLCFWGSMEIFAARNILLYLPFALILLYLNKAKPEFSTKLFTSIGSLMKLRLIEIVLSTSASMIAITHLSTWDLGMLNRLQAFLGFGLNFLNQVIQRNYASYVTLNQLTKRIKGLFSDIFLPAMLFFGSALAFYEDIIQGTNAYLSVFVTMVCVQFLLFYAMVRFYDWSNNELDEAMSSWKVSLIIVFSILPITLNWTQLSLFMSYWVLYRSLRGKINA